MAIIRAPRGFNFMRFSLGQPTVAPTGQLELDSRRIEPYNDSYSFTLESSQFRKTEMIFAGDGLSSAGSANISAFSYGQYNLSGADFYLYSSFDIEDVALTRSQADGLVNAMLGGDEAALDKLLRTQLGGDDTVYLSIGNDSGTISTYGGNDVIYAGGSGTIDAGAGNDVIDGRKQGPDIYDLSTAVYKGGTGNDTYYLSTSIVTVVEQPNAGIDTVFIDDVQRGFRYTMPANVEIATISSTVTGVVAGNALANQITGNNAVNDLYGGLGADRLFGLGGADRLHGGPGADQLFGGTGLDRLTGGTGADRFVFDTVPNAATNRDVITDFVSGEDTLAFSRKIFSGLGSASTLSAAAFISGAGFTTAHDASDRLIYNQTTGALFYDADGTGSVSAPVQIAQLGLTTHPALAATDFLILA